MATLTQEQTLASVTLDLVLTPWVEQAAPDPVVHTPLDGSPAWVAIVPVPPQRVTARLMVETQQQLTDALAILRTVGTIRIDDPAAPGGWRRYVVSEHEARLELPVWVITVNAVEVA